jgi:hypothetical protein
MDGYQNIMDDVERTSTYEDRNNLLALTAHQWGGFVCVLNPGEGVCADPVERVAILEVKGPGPPSGVSECQLSPDRGGKKT